MDPELYSDYLWFFQGERPVKNSFWKTYIGIMLMTPLLVHVGLNVHGYSQVVPISSQIEMAAVSPTIGEMHEHLGQAIKLIEDRGWTKGYTSIFFKTEDENVGAWHERLVTLYETLSSEQEIYYDQEIGLEGEPAGIRMKPVSMGLVQSSIVMGGARAILVDGSSARVPSGMTRFPSNVGMFVMAILSNLMWIIGTSLIIRKAKE